MTTMICTQPYNGPATDSLTGPFTGGPSRGALAFGAGSHRVTDARASSPHAVRGVLTIARMPTAARAEVESLMAQMLPPADVAELSTLDDDLLSDTAWFTRWRRDSFHPGRVECREVITAPPEDLARFERAVMLLARDRGFTADVCW
ncbi:hypothetical protein [Corynebacterium aquatimens]|uniref:Uncharacterized protein n=1 Tax=Corynebacterium aquatimens TaxID=1190508 RepID=A0A931E0I6_9CORY|nr:hypothetical protein [Corynebacterium aquatimens]MBG6122048.1 hypothetical protein [Corynebacterium aquatimens]WJY65411.1 hypothetical protein CAQUA_03480 [Corynebacterium aquatimens]